MSHGRQQHRSASRPSPAPKALPNANPNANTDLARRDEQPLQRSSGEVDILGVLARPAVKKAMAVRLGQLFGPDEMIAMVSTLLRQSPLLAKSDPMTVMGAVLECAQVGLRLDRALGQAYLVPFFSGKRRCYEAQLILGYRGMLTLAEQSGYVSAVRARIVYERDTFEYEEGLEPILKHKPCGDKDRGRPVYVYAVIHKPSGFASPYVIPWWKIDELRERQVARGNTIWDTNTDEMALKTAIRRSLKYHPLSPKQQRLANLDELAEQDVEQGLEFIGQEAMEQIAESAESLEAAKQQAAIEAETGAVMADRSDAEAPAKTDAPASSAEDTAGKLSAAEEAAFEAAQKGGK